MNPKSLKSQLYAHCYPQTSFHLEKLNGLKTKLSNEKKALLPKRLIDDIFSENGEDFSVPQYHSCNFDLLDIVSPPRSGQVMRNTF